MKVGDIVTYVPGPYDRRNMDVSSDASGFKSLVTTVRDNGLVDVVFGDSSGTGWNRTSVAIGAPGAQDEGWVNPI